MDNFRALGLRRKKELNRRSGCKRIFTIFALVFLLSVIGFIGVSAYYSSLVGDALSVIEEGSKETNAIQYKHQSEYMSDKFDTNKPFSVVIIGVDTRAGSGGTLNSDVMMVAVVDPNKHEAKLLSIPRDTKIHIPGTDGYRKANAAFAKGENKRKQQEVRGDKVDISGPALVQDMLSNYLEIPIHHYVTVDFNGFTEVIDTVGGIEIDVKKSMRYDSPKDGTHIQIDKGLQTLDGKKALDYVRHRLDNRGVNYQSSDFERNQRQQEVIKATLKKLISLEAISNFPEIMNSIARNTKTSLSGEQMKALVTGLNLLSPSQVESIDNQAYWDSGQSFTIIPEERLEVIQEELQQFLKGK